MKRILIFGLLGPPIGGLVVAWIVLPLMRGPEFGAQDLALALIIVPWSYLFGIVPAFLVAAFDWMLVRRGIARRPLWCAILSFTLGYVFLANSGQFPAHPAVLASGLVGAIPAAIFLVGQPPDRIGDEL